MTDIKRIGLVWCFLVLASAGPLYAYGYISPQNVDDYVSLGKSILIVECLPNDKDPIYGNVYLRSVRILDVLQGEFKNEQITHVAVDQDLVAGRVYMILSGSTLDEKGELNAFSINPGAVEINLWGEISKAEKEKRIADFLKELQPLPLKERVGRILTQRTNDLKWEQQRLETEKKRLDGMLSK